MGSTCPTVFSLPAELLYEHSSWARLLLKEEISSDWEYQLISSLKNCNQARGRGVKILTAICTCTLSAIVGSHTYSFKNNCWTVDGEGQCLGADEPNLIVSRWAKPWCSVENFVVPKIFFIPTLRGNFQGGEDLNWKSLPWYGLFLEQHILLLRTIKKKKTDDCFS